MRRITGVAGAALLVLLAGCAVAPEPGPTVTASSAAPTPTATPTPVEPARAAVDDMTVREQAASVVMGHIPTTDPGELKEYMSAGYGGFILMGANLSGDPKKVRRVTKAIRGDNSIPPLIAIDQEGGVVSRLAWDDFPAAERLATQTPEKTEKAFEQRADLVAEVGANTNFGIVADVPSGPESFIFSRSYGTTAAAVSHRVTAAVHGERSRVLSTLKHFPGHGAAAGDSHHVIPTTDRSYKKWQKRDAVPFAAGIDAGADLLMFGHLTYAKVDKEPASLSARWHEIARNKLGFDGVMITDDLGMLTSSGHKKYRDPAQTAVQALVAGNDMVLMVMGSTPDTAADIVDAIVDAVKDGTLSAERLRDASEHVMRLRVSLKDSE